MYDGMLQMILLNNVNFWPQKMLQGCLRQFIYSKFWKTSNICTRYCQSASFFSV